MLCFKLIARRYFKDKLRSLDIHYLLRRKLFNVQQGFTLIELLISISIMSLLFTVGYANYREFQRRQTVEAAARLLRTDLRYAQELALTGKKPTSGCSQLDGYRLDFRILFQDYSISPVCNGSVHGETVKTEDVPSGIVMSYSGGSGSDVLFRVLGGGTDVPTGSPLLIEFRHQAQTPFFCILFPWWPTCTLADPVSVTVTSSGEIY